MANCKENFKQVAGYIRSHKGQSTALLTSLLLGTTALATPFISTAIGAGAIMAGSVYMLTKTTDITLEGALSAGKKLKLSPLTLGLAIGALNTIPETMVSLGALFKGHTALGIGNIVGSNIAHTLLILGATAAVAGIKKSTEKGLSWTFNTWVMAGSSALFGAQLITGNLSPWMGAGMLGIGAYYLKKRLFNGGDKAEEPGTCLFHDHGDGGSDHHEHEHHDHSHCDCDCDHDHDHDHEHEHHHHKDEHEHGHSSDLENMPTWFKIGWGAAGFGGLMGAANVLVNSGMATATHFGVNEALIGTLAVAIGTSVPELMINIKAAMKNHSELAIGNVVGCNIFNTLIAGGVVALSGHAVPDSLSLQSPLGILNTSVFLGSTGILTAALLVNKGQLKRWHGFAALGMYGAYTAGAMALNDGKAQKLHDHGAHIDTPAPIVETVAHRPKHLNYYSAPSF